MNVLAIDIGTKTGWAANKGTQFLAGTWVLATEKELEKARSYRLDRRRDIRFHALCVELYRIRQMIDFDIVIFEDVEFQSSRLQMQLWASLRAAIWTEFPLTKPIVECVNVKVLKAFAGHGSANKQAMNNLLHKRYPAYWNSAYDDNAIDACWLWLWAQENLAHVYPNKTYRCPNK